MAVECGREERVGEFENSVADGTGGTSASENADTVEPEDSKTGAPAKRREY
jgi:hypothetical protein